MMLALSVVSALAVWLALNLLMLVRGGNGVFEASWVSREEFITLVNSGMIQAGDVDYLRNMIALPTYALSKGRND